MYKINDIPEDWIMKEREDIRLARAAQFAGFTALEKRMFGRDRPA